jgi:hypothetical protein
VEIIPGEIRALINLFLGSHNLVVKSEIEFVDIEISVIVVGSEELDFQQVVWSKIFQGVCKHQSIVLAAFFVFKSRP